MKIKGYKLKTEVLIGHIKNKGVIGESGWGWHYSRWGISYWDGAVLGVGWNYFEWGKDYWSDYLPYIGWSSEYGQKNYGI
ncbi:MAG: hypothetical protein ABIL76_07935 [candidate division WOR-3 bacterium]